MNLTLSILALLGAIAAGAASPGPSFLFVVRTAVAGSRKEGLAAAAGMGLGAVVFAVLVLGGLHALLMALGDFFVLLQVAGAAYLIYLAAELWHGARSKIQDVVCRAKAPNSLRNAFIKALLIQLSNPKAVVVYGSIFAALLPKQMPIWVALTLPVLVFIIETGWYAIVAFGLSTPSPRSVYLRWKPAIDRISGTVLGLIGVRLLLNAQADR